MVRKTVAETTMHVFESVVLVPTVDINPVTKRFNRSCTPARRSVAGNIAKGEPQRVSDFDDLDP